MSIEKVRAYFRQYGIEDRVREVEESSATVEAAAMALGCEPKRIAKTLSFYLGDSVILVVTAGDRKIDNKKYRAQFGCKAQMLKIEDVESMIGHAVGGVCPFAIHAGIEVYLDVSLQRFDTVFPAAGSGNSMIELNIKELEEYSHYKEWVDVCKER
ncbi:YbaK/EbsC family protein [[Clostridium] scindens]|uniref:YbaK/EbsC family protein n=1 Tax=Clostridium scindens (strain JCM 10418 / VPI 12708) TaxID=29347 RepID=UPI001C706273|nr:YbaK/EbsC family protein [[Clostridium] scindens]QYX25533.1 YbaK/EbsC family protein [[Clostridium] scindens]